MSPGAAVTTGSAEHRCAEHTGATRQLIASALGSDVATEFSEARADRPEPGPVSMQADLEAKAFFVCYLVAYLDKFSIAAQWPPCGQPGRHGPSRPLCNTHATLVQHRCTRRGT